MPGFIFWGLFLVLALILVGYTIWMFWVEKKGLKWRPCRSSSLRSTWPVCSRSRCGPPDAPQRNRLLDRGRQSRLAARRCYPGRYPRQRWHLHRHDRRHLRGRLVVRLAALVDPALLLVPGGGTGAALHPGEAAHPAFVPGEPLPVPGCPTGCCGHHPGRHRGLHPGPDRRWRPDRQRRAGCLPHHRHGRLHGGLDSLHDAGRHGGRGLHRPVAAGGHAVGGPYWRCRSRSRGWGAWASCCARPRSQNRTCSAGQHASHAAFDYGNRLHPGFGLDAGEADSPSTP